MADEEFTLNGQALQHANTDVRLVGPVSEFELTTQKKVNYKEGAHKEAVRNKQGKIIGFVLKNQETEGAISLRKEEWRAVKKWAAEQFPDDNRGIGQMLFVLSATFGTTANPSELHTERVNIMFQEDPVNSEDNQDPLVCEVPLFVFGSIEREGERPFIQY